MPLKYSSKLDPYIKEIGGLYISGKSTKEIREIIKNKYFIILSLEIYRRKIKKLNIMRSNSEAIKISNRKHLPIKEIINLYTNKGLSLRKIAKLFISNKKTVQKILQENGIYVRNSRESQISVGYIKEKSKFNLAPQEKAYIFGLVSGDLTPVKKSNYTLKLITHTTHPGFVQLLQTTFGKYGVFSSKINKNKEFRCSVYLDLESFSFLFDYKCDKIPEWVWHKNLFHYFAGYIDSDGCITIKRSEKYFQFVIKFCGENLNLLKEIKKRLENLGYSPSIHRNHKKGDFSYNQGKKITYNKDYYVIEVGSKQQVLQLLNAIPIRHPEKIAKKNLIFDINRRGLIYWQDIKEDVLKLRQQIKEEVQSRLKVN